MPCKRKKTSQSMVFRPATVHHNNAENCYIDSGACNVHIKCQHRSRKSLPQSTKLFMPLQLNCSLHTEDMGTV
jgi:hypothetical protein